MAMVTEMRIPGGEAGGTRFNYRGMHRYLITLLPHPGCTALADRETVLTTLGVLRESCRQYGFEAYAYCFLQDRLVLLVRGKEETADMKLFLAAFRAASAAEFEKRAGTRLWSRKFRERVLRKAEVTRAIAAEIFALPVKAGLAPAPEAYPFQGSFVLPPGALAPRRTRRSGPSPGSRRPGPRHGARRPSRARRR